MIQKSPVLLIFLYWKFSQKANEKKVGIHDARIIIKNTVRIPKITHYEILEDMREFSLIKDINKYHITLCEESELSELNYKELKRIRESYPLWTK